MVTKLSSLLFTTQYPGGPLRSFDRPQKDERLGCPWSHPKVLNLELRRLNHLVIALFRKEPQRIQGDFANLTFTDLDFFQYPSIHLHE